MPHNQGHYHPFQGNWNHHIPSDPVNNMSGGNNPMPFHGQTGPSQPFLASHFDSQHYQPGRNLHPYPTVQPVQASLPPPSMPLVAHRANVPNLRLTHHAQQGMTLGHGVHPHFHSAGTPSFWQVSSQAPATPVTTPQTLPNGHFPPNPTYNGTAHTHKEPNLVPFFDGHVMSRVSSDSWTTSSPSDSSYYTPISGSEGGDYFGYERELRSVSAAVDGHYPRVDAGYSYGSSSGPMPSTISLSRIQDDRLAVKFEPAPSVVTDSEHASPALSIHPSPRPLVIKPEYSSPQPHHVSSPVPSDSRPSPVCPQERWHPALGTDSGHFSNGPSPSGTASTLYVSDSQDDDNDYVTEEDWDDDDFRLPPPKAIRRKQKKSFKTTSAKSKKRSSSSPRGNTSTSSAKAATRLPQPDSQNTVSRAALLHRYPRLPLDFPLLFHALEPDMSINQGAAPKIGTIPKSVTPDTKSEVLRRFYHRGRRVIQQLDEFASLVKPGANSGRAKETQWLALSLPYAKSLIAVRRKIVERTENYKYTRRDTLRKAHGKCCPDNSAGCIEHGMIRWDPGSCNNDPARDLENWDSTFGSDHGSPVPVRPCPVIQHVASQLGQLEIRPVGSRSSMRSLTRPQPSPITVHHGGSTGHERSCHHAAAASVPNHVPNTMPPTPVSVVSTEGDILGLSPRVAEFNSDAGHSINAGQHSNRALPPSPLPSPSPLGLGLTVSPSGRAPAIVSVEHASHSKGHSRSYSTDTDRTSSTVEY